MPSEWPIVRVADCCELIVDCVNKTAPVVEYETPYRMIRTTNVRNGFIDLSDCRFVDEATFRTWTRRAPLLDGDVILTREAPIGEVGLVRGDQTIFLGQRLMQYRANRTVLDPRFLCYAFLSPQLQHQFGAHEGSGSVVSHIRVGDCSSFKIPLPPLAEQRAIADLLSALDERRLLLLQTNTTLESIARTLFKSWFVDFDPVRAKAEGREPEGMAAGTAALFPSEFEESVIGSVPKGWEVCTLSSHLDVERGLSYKGAGLCEVGEGLPMHNLNSVLEGGGYKYAGIKHYRGDYKERHIAAAGDVIVANTEQGHNHRLIGFPAVVPARYDKALYSHHIYRVRPKPDSPLTTHTLYYMLMAPAVREQIVGCANGSTVNMLKTAGLEIPQFVCPSAQAARAFEELARPLRTQMEANVERAQALATLRDTLLPRLISGKLPLAEAAAQLNEAVA